MHLRNIKKSVSIPDIKNENFFLMKDICYGFKSPSILDLKLGIRTWEMGASEEKKRRHMNKCRMATSGTSSFRIRACLWYSDHPEKWDRDGAFSYVTRDFGMKCTDKQMTELIEDFFKYKEQIPFYIDKLRKIEDEIAKLRTESNIRLYSTSILFAYDNDNPKVFDCRLLDFAKSYFEIDKLAPEFKESVEECEDGVIPGLRNIISVLEAIE